VCSRRTAEGAWRVIWTLPGHLREIARSRHIHRGARYSHLAVRLAFNDDRGLVRRRQAFENFYVALALIGYAQSGYSWWLFAALILVPDVSMFGYLINPSIGAASYKPCAHAHSADSASLRGGTIRQYAAPCGRHDPDRALGYGLKYATGFGDTHLSDSSRSPMASRFGDSRVGSNSIKAVHHPGSVKAQP
jgi:Domain of unknown function (DUF4260)